jgi:hypothetical protein
VEFNLLKMEIKKIELDITRVDGDDYFEIVVKSRSLGDMVHLLESIFGAPAWPSRNKMSKKIEKAVKNFGSLRQGQTLYVLNTDSFSIFVMLWPWQNGERVTIKVAKI